MWVGIVRSVCSACKKRKVFRLRRGRTSGCADKSSSHQWMLWHALCFWWMVTIRSWWFCPAVWCTHAAGLVMQCPLLVNGHIDRFLIHYALRCMYKNELSVGADLILCLLLASGLFSTWGRSGLCSCIIYATLSVLEKNISYAIMYTAKYSNNRWMTVFPPTFRFVYCA